MRWPCLKVLLPFLGGILCADLASLSFVTLGSCAVLTGMVALFWRNARRWTTPAWLAIAGAASLELRTARLSSDDLRCVAGARPQLVSIEGVLPETPWLREYERDGRTVRRTLARLDAVRICLSGTNWQSVSGRVMVSTPGVLSTRFYGGETICVTGVLEPPPGPLFEGGFDYRYFLRRQCIYFQLRAEGEQDWRMVRALSRPPVVDRFSEWAQQTLALGMPEVDEPLRLLWTMTLGWKTGLNNEVARPFMRSGTLHVFAISGLHIALISGILVALLRVMRVPRAACGVVVIPLIWFYTGVTGWQASAVRSTVMMSVIIVGWTLRRPGNLLNSLAAAAFIILACDPQQLFQASFQLSFGAVLSLALFAPVFQRCGRGWLQPNLLRPPDLRPKWQGWMLVPARWLVACLATSLAASAGTFPLVAWYFHLFSPVSLLANVAVVPLSSLALTASLGSLLTGAWWPAMAALFNHSAWLWMKLMIVISEWCARLPGGCWNVEKPGLPALLFYYAALVAVTGGWLARPSTRKWAAAVLVLLSAVWLGGRWRHSGEAHLTVLPVSGGHAVFCEGMREPRSMLVDCGNANSAGRIVDAFLRARGVNRLDAFVLTHGELRQMGGADLVLTNYHPRQVVLNPLRFRSTAWRGLLKSSSLPEHRRQLLKRGDRLGSWEVSHPGAELEFRRADDACLVMRGRVNGTTLLLLSDLGREGQQRLLTLETNLAADLVVAGLPGEGEPLCDALLAAIHPRLVILADSNWPASRKASDALVSRIKQTGCDVICASRAAGLSITFDRQGRVLISNAGGPDGENGPADGMDGAE
jgi:ComEC/Rec2-related protein